jgi:hypothetical protein
MAFESRVRPRQFWFTVGYAVLCAVLGLWGAYDYWKRIPRQEAEFAEYQSATERVKRYADRSVPGAPRLTAEEESDYQQAREVVDRFASGAPTPVAFYDRPLQLWVYMLGCGIVGTGWCVVSLVRTSSRSFKLDDQGMLHAGTRRIGPDEVTGIDMARWMAKSIATLRVRDGAPIVLDDYKYGGMHLIVGTYAHRFDPQRWNADATPVKRGAEPATAGPGSGSAAAEPITAPHAAGSPGELGANAAPQDRFPST